jgi:alpha-L-fucosidase
MNRREFIAVGASAALVPRVRFEKRLIADRPRPTSAQLEWQRDELAMFLHFGVNTFTNREWGDGTEDPKIFNPVRLDARQWTRAAKAAGFRALILTAKHHDGFCLWPTRTTTHSVASSLWRGGQGDVVQELVDACRADSLKLGVYLSPWDRNASVYGDSPRYNDFYIEQLTELLTGYGMISEVWFDGANGEGPNGKKQTYDWPRIWGTVRKLQPNAVMFSDAGPDVRWIGNERGVAGTTNWSTVDPSVVPFPGATGDAVMRMLQQGDPSGTVWRPGETDVSIRPGWFYHAAEDARVKSADDLVGLYFTSVGRNSKLLLNVPPAPDGLLGDADVSRLAEMRSRLDSDFSKDLAAGARTSWKPADRTAVLDIDLGDTRRFSIADLREDVTQGQTIASYALEREQDGRWQTVSEGMTIGFRKLDRFAPVDARRLRLTVRDAVDAPREVRVSLFA